MTHRTVAEMRRLRATAQEPLADASDGPNANGNPVGVVSASQKEPNCATAGCSNAVVPGEDYCDACMQSWPDGGGPNSGPDGSWSDGTGFGNDPNGSQDGTLRGGRNYINWNDGTMTPVPGLKKTRHKGPSIGHRAVLLNAAAMDAPGEFRVSTNTNAGTLVSGTGSTYNNLYDVYDFFGRYSERFSPGAFASVAARADCRFLINHDGLALARTTSGTLVLRDTAQALTFAAYLDESSYQANDLLSTIRRGDVSQCSIGFIVADDTWDEDMTTRTIIRVAELLDVSAVTYPANPSTTIGIGASADASPVRSLDLQRERALAQQRDLNNRRIHLIGGATTMPTTTKTPEQVVERDDLQAKNRTPKEAGELRKRAMQLRGAASYRELRVAINNGRDLMETI